MSTRVRLEQILKEIEDNPDAFVKDAHIYFQEFLPVLEKALPVEKKPEPAPKPEPKPIPKPAPKPEPKKTLFKKKKK